MSQKYLWILILPYLAFVHYKLSVVETRSVNVSSDTRDGNNWSEKNAAAQVINPNPFAKQDAGYSEKNDEYIALAESNQSNLTRLEETTLMLSEQLAELQNLLQNDLVENVASPVESRSKPEEDEILARREQVIESLDSQVHSEQLDIAAIDIVNSTIQYGALNDIDLQTASIGEALCTSSMCKLSYTVRSEMTDDEKFLFENKLYALMAKAGISSSNMNARPMADGTVIVDIYAQRDAISE